MKSLYFIFYFFITVGIMSAQSTGYMGKRFLIGYGFHTSPAFTGSNANNESIIGGNGSAETGVAAFNFIHEGFIEFAPSSKWLICFSARFYNTTYDNRVVFRDRDQYYNSSNVTFNTTSPNGYYDIKGRTYTLYFKYYGQRYVAPWGRYVMFGPTLNTAKASYDPAVMNIKGYYNSGGYGGYSYSDTLVSDFGPQEQSYKGLNFMIGFGRTRIIANRVTVDYGCNIQFFSLLNTLFDANNTGFFHRSETLDNTNYIERTVYNRIRGVNRFNVFLKVGVLLF